MQFGTKNWLRPDDLTALLAPAMSGYHSAVHELSQPQEPAKPPVSAPPPVPQRYDSAPLTDTLQAPADLSKVPVTDALYPPPDAAVQAFMNEPNSPANQQSRFIPPPKPVSAAPLAPVATAPTPVSAAPLATAPGNLQRARYINPPQQAQPIATAAKPVQPVPAPATPALAHVAPTVPMPPPPVGRDLTMPATVPFPAPLQNQPDLSKTGRPRQVSKTFRTEGLNPIGVLRQEQGATEAARGTEKTVKTPYGYENQPGKKLSRWSGLLHGILQGVQQGAAYGPGGVIGGAIRGAAQGAISPGSIRALEREAASKEIQKRIEEQQGNEMRSQQISAEDALSQQRARGPKPIYRRVGKQLQRIDSYSGVATPVTDPEGNPIAGQARLRQTTILDADGVTRRPAVIDLDTGEVSLVHDGDGQSVASGYTQPVSSETGMTAAQTASDKNRKESLNQGERRIAQGDQRIGISRQRMSNDRDRWVKQAEESEAAEADAGKRYNQAKTDHEKLVQQLGELKKVPKKIVVGKNASGAPVYGPNPEYQTDEVDKLTEELKTSKTNLDSINNQYKDAAKEARTARSRATAVVPPNSRTSKPSNDPGGYFQD